MDKVGVPDHYKRCLIPYSVRLIIDPSIFRPAGMEARANGGLTRFMPALGGKSTVKMPIFWNQKTAAAVPVMKLRPPPVSVKPI